MFRQTFTEHEETWTYKNKKLKSEGRIQIQGTRTYTKKKPITADSYKADSRAKDKGKMSVREAGTQKGGRKRHTQAGSNTNKIQQHKQNPATQTKPTNTKKIQQLKQYPCSRGWGKKTRASGCEAGQTNTSRRTEIARQGALRLNSAPPPPKKEPRIARQGA